PVKAEADTPHALPAETRLDPPPHDAAANASRLRGAEHLTCLQPPSTDASSASAVYLQIRRREVERRRSGRRRKKMSYLLPHLHSGWAVDQAILAEEERLVIIRFGHDWDETCMQMDEVLAAVAETIKNFAVIYLVDITEVPDFNTMYELYDPSTVMFFFRNKHIMIDLGTGNNNKINWALKDKQEFVDIVETVYRGARKGRGLVIAPKDYSTKYRY
uniref:Thioredoxin-like protein YLS8 n=6 Tax=Panicoideae TaxID=147369 RepID=K3YME3_SETIT